MDDQTQRYKSKISLVSNVCVVDTIPICQTILRTTNSCSYSSVSRTMLNCCGNDGMMRRINTHAHTNASIRLKRTKRTSSSISFSWPLGCYFELWVHSSTVIVRICVALQKHISVLCFELAKPLKVVVRFYLYFMSPFNIVPKANQWTRCFFGLCWLEVWMNNVLMDREIPINSVEWLMGKSLSRISQWLVFVHMLRLNQYFLVCQNTTKVMNVEIIL